MTKLTKQQLEQRAQQLEAILDDSDDETMPDVEQELCNIYGMLRGLEN